MRQFVAFTVLLVLTGMICWALGFWAGITEPRRESVIRPLPVAWSNFGTCGAKALGSDFIQWTCRIDQ